MSLAPLDGPLVTEIHPNKAEALMHSSIEARLRASTGGAINIFRYAAFTILEGRDDQLFLATRNTAPHTGIYSAIGGKCDPVKGRDIRYPTNQPWDMLVRGWERLAQTARREAIEEAFCNQKNEYNLQVHGYEPEDDAVLEAVWPLAAFQRLAVVYDNIFNVYCAVYKSRIPDGWTISLSARELRDIKSLAEIISQDLLINCMTDVVLRQLGLLSGKQPSCSYRYGKITKMATARDAIVVLGEYPCNSGGMSAKPLNCSKEIEGPGYFIDY